MSTRYAVLFAASLVASSLCHSAFASPYAAQLTTSGGNLNFTLTEDADEVIIVRNGTATSLGAMTGGAQSVALNGATNYQVIVRKNTNNGYLNVDNNDRGTVSGSGVQGPQGVEHEIGDANANRGQQFELPRDVIINKNPATPELFGRTYVLQTRTASTASGRPTTEGIYILNADRTQSSLNPGDTALTGGVTFDGVATNVVDLYKGQLDEDGNLYVSDWSDPQTPGVRTWDPNISTGGNVLVGTAAATSPPSITPTATQNHGSVSGLIITGSASKGNLVLRTVDEDLGIATAGDASAGNNAIYTYQLGSQRLNNGAIPTVSSVQPLYTASVDNDLEQGLGGRLYLTQYRSDGVDTGLFVLTPNADRILYNSFADAQLLGIDGNTANTTTLAGNQDMFRLIRGTDVSPDGKWFAGQSDSGGRAWVAPLIEGIPDLANTRILTFGSGSGTNIEFDAAGNLWTANRSNERVREWSPGGPSYTVYSSDGTFKYINGKEFDGSGSYKDASKWAFGRIAGFGNATDDYALYAPTEDAANIGALTSGAQTITLDDAVVLATLTFKGGDYTVNAGNSGSLRMGSDTAFESYLEGRIVAEAGNQVINAPITITKSFGVAAYTGSSLTLNNLTFTDGPVSTTTNLPVTTNGTYTVQKFGGGTVSMPTFTQKQLIVRDGTLKFNTAASGQAAKVTNLVIAGTGGATPTPTAALDLGSTGLVLDYASDATTSPYATVLSLVTSGRNGGTYTGMGINSSLAAGNPGKYGVGIAEASTLGVNTLMGQSLDGTAVIVRATLLGDTNLDGSVGFNDLLALAKSYNGSNKAWTDGDSDYNGAVEFADLLALAKNYNGTLSASQSAELGAFSADFALAQSLVPEPATLGAILGLGGLALGRRRR